MGRDDGVSIVLNRHDDFERQPLADNVVDSPCGNRLLSPVVNKLIVYEGVVDECLRQRVEIRPRRLARRASSHRVSEDVVSDSVTRRGGHQGCPAGSCGLSSARPAISTCRCGWCFQSGRIQGLTRDLSRTRPRRSRRFRLTRYTSAVAPAPKVVDLELRSRTSRAFPKTIAANERRRESPRAQFVSCSPEVVSSQTRERHDSLHSCPWRCLFGVCSKIPCFAQLILIFV